VGRATPAGRGHTIDWVSFMGAGHLTAVGAVDLIVTNLAAIQVTPAGLLFGELAPGVTFDYVQSLTEPLLIRSADLREMEL